MKDIALVADADKIAGLKSQIDTCEEEALGHLQTVGEVYAAAVFLSIVIA